MKKLTMLALVAMMLIGMLAFTACKTQEETEIQTTEEIDAADTMTVIDDMAEGVQNVREGVKDGVQEVKEGVQNAGD